MWPPASPTPTTPDPPVPATPPSLPPTVQIVTGPGGLPQLHIATPLLQARVSLQGAQLLSFQPRGQSDWLFLSPRAVFAPGQPVRGGIPVCWPWFGPDPGQLGRPAHGFARDRLWTWREAQTEPDGTLQLGFVLHDDDSTRALWPHRFELALTLRLGKTLSLALNTRNTGDNPFEITQALHSYFAVEHIDTVRVCGLQGCHYLDKVAGAPSPGPEPAAELRFEDRLDRIYQDVPTPLALLGSTIGRPLSLHSEGSRTAVVWNPGEALADRMADLGPGTHHRFVCVETANAGSEVIRLAPGQTHRLAVHIHAGTGPSSPSAVQGPGPGSSV